MEAVIIADDLTGANDSGVQLARRGLTTSVLFEMNAGAVSDQDVIVLNTDSRASSSEVAYMRVVEAARFLSQFSTKLVYKKIDSILRGNIGAELDATYDVFKPDFLVIAPAYPDNGRTTIHGVHYLDGIPVHETDIGADRITPVTHSYIPALLAQQTNRLTGLISLTELRSDGSLLVRRLDRLHSDGVQYVISDAESEADLYALVEGVVQSGYRVVWVGSAGLARCLPVELGNMNPRPRLRDGWKTEGLEHPRIKRECLAQESSKSVLVAVGSITERSHTQLQVLLASQDTVGIELQPERFIGESEEREWEICRACEMGVQGLRNGKHVVVYVPVADSTVTHAIKAGLLHNKDRVDVSNSIAGAIGEIIAYLMHAGDWVGLVMTGGDTATQICNQLGIERFELLDEVESGVPIGLLRGGKQLPAVTKAGSFGTDAVLLHAVTMLKERSRL